MATNEDYFYAYSKNPDLLKMNVAELSKVPNLKVKMITVNSSHRCVPFDEFLGYDTYSIYAFANLIIPYGGTGYFSTYLRNPDSSNYFFLDFDTDFKDSS